MPRNPLTPSIRRQVLPGGEARGGPREGHQKWIIWSSSSRTSYMDSSIDSQDQAEPPELTYIDIDPFLESF